MKNVNGKSEKTANVVLSSNNKAKVSFASVLDAIIINCKKDTTLQTIADNCNEIKKQYNNKINYTASTIKAHIHYRIVTQKQKLYLSSHNLTLKDNVIKVKVNKVKVNKETVTETETK